MTRFKTGSKVEVFSTREVPSGSWYLAEIIHGNGHYYTVKYENGAVFQVYDRVPRKAIRPCPPPLQVLDWALGDVVEVFHHFSWKMATVLKALQTGWILVRLLGSSHELEVSEVNARPRVFLHDDEWNVVGKGSSNSEKRHNVHSLMNNHNSRQMETTTSISLKNSYFPCSINNGGTQEVLDGPKSLKRKFKTCYPESGAHAGQDKKVNKRRNKIISTILQPPLPVKKDAVASSRVTQVEKSVPPFTNQLTGFSKKSMGRERMGGSLGCSRAISSDSRGANSITSSVASCSMSAEEQQQTLKYILSRDSAALLAMSMSPWTLQAPRRAPHIPTWSDPLGARSIKLTASSSRHFVEQFIGIIKKAIVQTPRNESVPGKSVLEGKITKDLVGTMYGVAFRVKI
ncbi:hypothetical protein V2J09_000240 [Rumex salicifolius]